MLILIARSLHASLAAAELMSKNGIHLHQHGGGRDGEGAAVVTAEVQDEEAVVVAHEMQLGAQARVSAGQARAPLLPAVNFKGPGRGTGPCSLPAACRCRPG